MTRGSIWSRERCIQCVDEFVRREQRYPTRKECTPDLGLPSNTAFHAHVGINVFQYCKAKYPEYDTELPTTERLVLAEKSILDMACRTWCSSLEEYPERIDGQGFAEFVQELQRQQTQSQANRHMGGMSMS